MKKALLIFWRVLLAIWFCAIPPIFCLTSNFLPLGMPFVAATALWIGWRTRPPEVSGGWRLWRGGVLLLAASCAVAGGSFWLGWWQDKPWVLVSWYGLELPCLAMAAGAAWLYARWLTRLPGGLKGWRLGLLLAPGIGLLWSWVEGWRCIREVCRDGGIAVRWGWAFRWCRLSVAAAVWPMAIGIGMAVIPTESGDIFSNAFARLEWWGTGIYTLILAFLPLWMYSFAGFGMPLDAALRHREVMPTSGKRFRRQLAALLLLGWGVPAAWYAVWSIRAEMAIRSIVAQIEADGNTVDGRLWERLEKLAYSFGYGHIRPETVWARPPWAYELPEIGKEELPLTPEVKARWSGMLAAAAGCEALFDQMPPECDFSAAEVGRRVVLGRYYLLKGMLALDAGDDPALAKCLERLFAVSAAGDEELFRIFDGAAELLAASARHGAWARWDEATLERVRDAVAAVDRDARDTRRYLALCIGMAADPAALVHAGYRVGDLSRAFKAPWMRQGRAELIGELYHNYRDAAEDGSGPLFHLREKSFYHSLESIGIWRNDIGSNAKGFRNSILTRQRGVRVGAALELYRRRHGVFPETLDELAPEFLAAVPPRTHARQPFFYRPGPPATLSRSDKYSSVELTLP